MTTVFNSASLGVRLEPSGDSAYDHITGSLIRNGLKVLFPPGRFLGQDTSSEEEALPVIKKVRLPGSSLGISIVFTARHYPGLESFFYEMLSRWLVPRKRLEFRSFFYSNFFFPSAPLERCSFCEVRFFCKDQFEYEEVSQQFEQIESEIRLGALSLHQGKRILELKGHFSSDKNVLIHEKVASLIQRRSEDFDYDIFGQMQHFFVNCRDDFKQMREAHHLSRVVYIFYLFRKSLKGRSELFSKERHVSFKVGHLRLYSPFGVRKVLGIFLGVNFLKRYEVFEERHLVKALQEYLPAGRLVQGSQFSYLQKEEKIHIFYLEVEREDGECFSSEEISHLRRKFPGSMESQVEKLMPSVFMPRNEEEVMKNILMLNCQLKYVKDIPQVFISFEGQSDRHLTFTVVLLRVLREEGSLPVQELFSRVSSRCIFIEDRIKKMGFIRRKYLKEATVFRLKLPKASYLRKDHSVDLLRARQDVVKELEEAVGEFRDYNGGMIANQLQNLYSFKKLLFSEKGIDELEVENFFYAISPVEMRSVVDPFLLKVLYELWKVRLEEKEESSQSYSLSVEGRSVVVLGSFSDGSFQASFMGFMKGMGLRSSQSLRFSSKKNARFYLGYILLGLSQDVVKQFSEKLREFEAVSVH